MKRKLIAHLENWSISLQKKPLLLIGAKGTGKTYLALAFANNFYDTYTYWNFENNPVNTDSLLQAGKDDLTAFFSCIQTKSKNPASSGSDTAPEKHLFILDEIFFCSKSESIITKLLEFYPDGDILAVSSIMPALSCTHIDKWEEDFQVLKLYPMDFEEFLMATGNEWYIEVIKEEYRSGRSIPEIVHSELLELLEEYFCVGGLPQAVNEYITSGCKDNITEIHRNILYSYLFEAGIRKNEGCALKVKQIFYSLPEQLSKCNKKFQYNLIRRGATEGLFLEGHTYIKDTWFGIYNSKLTDNEIEDNRKLSEQPKNAATKIYLFDVGLYHSLCGMTGIKKDKDYREGLLETYTAEALTASGIDFGYWETASGSCSLFLLNEAADESLISASDLGEGYNPTGYHSKEYRPLGFSPRGYYPMEIREKGGNRSKVLASFRERHPDIQTAIKITADKKENEKKTESVQTLSLYSIFCLGPMA